MISIESRISIQSDIASDARLRYSTQTFERIRKWLSRPSALERWSVRIVSDHIVTADGYGELRYLAIADLTKIVVATDDSGPWGADVVYLLHGVGPDPVGMFPLEATGSQTFVEWLSQRAGYNDREHRRAMGSTRVARFTIFEAAPADQTISS